MRPYKELKLQLFVHIPNDQVISLNINSNSTIGDLKSALELRAGILSDLQDLYVNNIKVMEKDTFSSVKVKNGSLLQLKFKEKMFRNVYIDAFNGDSKKVFKHEIEAIHGEELNVLDEVSIVLNKMASLKAFQAGFIACFKGHVALLRKIIIKNSAVIESTTKNGRSLLHVAADAGNYSCLAVLLKKGSQLCKKDNDGFTALHLATANGHSQCEKYLATHDLKFFCGGGSNLNKEKSEKFFPPIIVHTTNVNEVHEKKKLNQEQLPTLETLPSQEQLSAQQQFLTLEQLPTLEQLSTREKFLAHEKNLSSIDKPINIQNQVDIKDIQCSRKKVCQLFRSRSAPQIQTIQQSNLASTSYTNQSDLKDVSNNKKNEECKKISKQLFNTGISEKFLSSTPLSNFNMNKAMFTQQSIRLLPDKDSTKLTIPWSHAVEKRITISKSFSHFQEYPKPVCKKFKVQNASIESKPSKNKKLCLKQTKVPNIQTVLSLERNFSILNRITDGKVFFLDSSFLTFVNEKNIFLNNLEKLKGNIENAETCHNNSVDSSASNKVSLTVTNKKEVFKVQPHKYQFEAKSHVYHKTSLTVYKLKRKEVKRITFEEWVFLKKQLQNKNKTFETPSVANSSKSKNQKSHAVSFETWLQKKRAHEELKKQKQAELDLKKENESLLMSNSRHMDPHQRTFEEWFFEKKSQQKHQEKKVFKRKVSSAEDRELIFNLWLLDKFKAEIQTETELLMKERFLSSSMDY
ncbi:uncharacterized protein LOC105843433 isoform X2 [Hydra vulgaris]|uniref:Uncharacterized protein LOC105843433 isoform X2 n=1 Tax=Hydra vulgaris TaxID=6087 RepID=A0ABM4DKM9_HYDVU